MDNTSLFEYHVVGLVVCYLHILDDFLLDGRWQLRQRPVLLEAVPNEIPEHHSVEVLPDDLGKSFPSQYQTFYIILRFDCHFAHRIVVQRHLTETLPTVHFSLLDSPLVQTSDALLNDVEG